MRLKMIFGLTQRQLKEEWVNNFMIFLCLEENGQDPNLSLNQFGPTEGRFTICRDNIMSKAWIDASIASVRVFRVATPGF